MFVCTCRKPAEENPKLAEQFKDTSRLEKQRASAWDQLGKGDSYDNPAVWALPPEFKGKSEEELQQLYNSNLIAPNEGEDPVAAYLREHLTEAEADAGEDKLNLLYTCCKAKGLKQCVNTTGEPSHGPATAVLLL